MKLTFRIPSKAIQYGYVELEQEMDAETPEEVATKYMEAVSRFQIAEMDYVKAKQKSVKAPIEEPVDVAQPEASDTDHIHSFTWVDDENGHSGSFCVHCDAPESPESEVKAAAETVATGLGASVVDDDVPPWEIKATAPVEPPAWAAPPTFNW